MHVKLVFEKAILQLYGALVEQGLEVVYEGAATAAKAVQSEKAGVCVNFKDGKRVSIRAIGLELYGKFVGQGVKQMFGVVREAALRAIDPSQLIDTREAGIALCGKFALQEDYDLAEQVVRGMLQDEFPSVRQAVLELCGKLIEKERYTVVVGSDARCFKKRRRDDSSDSDQAVWIACSGRTRSRDCSSCGQAVCR